MKATLDHVIKKCEVCTRIKESISEDISLLRPQDKWRKLDWTW